MAIIHINAQLHSEIKVEATLRKIGLGEHVTFLIELGRRVQNDRELAGLGHAHKDRTDGTHGANKKQRRPRG